MIAAMRAAPPALSTRRLCHLAGAGRTWCSTRPSPEDVAARDRAWRDAIERLVLEFPGYGYRRVTQARQREGWAVNHQRVLRVLRQEALVCPRKRRVVAMTAAAHGLRPSPTLRVDVAIARPDQVWVADSTSSRWPAAFVSLAGVLDACSRRCVGWQLARTIDTRLTRGALDRALAARQPAPGLIHHADRGVQYASAAYVARRAGAGARLSMAAVGNPDDNAKAERCFKTLKREEGYLHE